MTGFQFMMAGLALGYVAFVLVYARISEPLRKRWIYRATRSKSRRVRLTALWLEELLECPFCTAFWVAAGTLAAFRFDVFSAGVFGIVLTGLSLAWMAGVAAFLINDMLTWSSR